MSTFWIVGIVFNVGLTALAIWWLWGLRAPKDPKQDK